VRDFPQSNGTGAPGLPGRRAALGVLKVTAKDGLSDEELNHKLLDLARDRGLKSVYYVTTLGGKREPRLLYRLTLDGKRELVRGAVLDDLDPRALRSGVVAAGSQLWVASFFSEVPFTVLAPALLMRTSPSGRANEKKRQAALLSPPE